MEISPSYNLTAALLADVREYIDFRVRQIEQCNNVDPRIDESVRQLKYVIFNPDYKAVYFDLPFAYPQKIKEIRDINNYAPIIKRVEIVK